MWINERVREREKKKKNINDINMEFKYVRSMIPFIKGNVIKHQRGLIPN